MSYATFPSNADAVALGMGPITDARDKPSIQTEMPKYECHKRVWALKIKAIRQTDGESNFEGGSWLLDVEEPGYAPIEVSHRDYVLKHSPYAGGYYVVYADGYKSFSPAKAFEDGYTRV